MRIRKLIPIMPLLLAGCVWKEYLFVEQGFEPGDYINYALASNGAKVTVSQDNPRHPASTLINGIKDPNLWDGGEGWEAECLKMAYDLFDRKETSVLALGWVIIELPEPKRINRIIIYTLDSEKYPAHVYGVKDLVIQYKPYNPSLPSPGWFGIERTDRKLGQPLSGVRDNKEGIIDLRFKPVLTQAVRITIQGTNDMKLISGFPPQVRGTIRLLEIEIYGLERKGSSRPSK